MSIPAFYQKLFLSVELLTCVFRCEACISRIIRLWKQAARCCRVVILIVGRFVLGAVKYQALCVFLQWKKWTADLHAAWTWTTSCKVIYPHSVNVSWSEDIKYVMMKLKTWVEFFNFGLWREGQTFSVLKPSACTHLLELWWETLASLWRAKDDFKAAITVELNSYTAIQRSTATVKKKTTFKAF